MDKDIYEVLNDTAVEEYDFVQLSDEERKRMKKNFNKNFKKGHKKYYVLAACIVAAVACSQTAFAQTLVVNIIRSVTTGHNIFSVIEEPTTAEVPEEYKGVFFDKDGNELGVYERGTAVYDADGNMLFDENGEQIAEYAIVNDDGSQIKVGKGKRDIIAEGTNDTYFVVTDESKVAEKLNFSPAMPTYLPDGYEFYGATLYKDDDGSVSGDYLAMYYKNSKSGKQFSIHERVINDETAFETGTSGELIETTIHGNKAVVMANKSIDWEEKGVAVSVLGGESKISADELIKVAESTVMQNADGSLN